MDSDRRKNYLRFCFRSNIKEPFLYSSFGCYLPQTKLWKGNVFTPVCQSSVHRGGVHTTPGRHPCGQRPPIGRRTQADTPPSGSPPPGRHPPRRQTPPTPEARCSGRYASYWNAFLFVLYLHCSCLGGLEIIFCSPYWEKVPPSLIFCSLYWE